VTQRRTRDELNKRKKKQKHLHGRGRGEEWVEGANGWRSEVLKKGRCGQEMEEAGGRGGGGHGGRREEMGTGRKEGMGGERERAWSRLVGRGCERMMARGDGGGIGGRWGEGNRQRDEGGRPSAGGVRRNME